MKEYLQRTVLKWFLIIVTGLFLLALGLLAPIDNRPALNRLGMTDISIPDMQISGGSGNFLAGWSAINITPPSPLRLAGYGPRGPFTSILDSLYVRVVIIDNGEMEAIIISMDLLMFPPLLKNRIEASLASNGISKNQIYLAATHTHHAFGNWEKSIGGELIFGKYDAKNFDHITNCIYLAIKSAREKKSPSKLAFGKADAGELAINRLDSKNGAKDPFLRTILLENDLGKKAIIVAFAGHATTLDADAWEISRDYPGIIVDELEANDSIDFAMFCAGMVGSHNIDIDVPKGHDRMYATGKRLAGKLMNDSQELAFETNSVIAGQDIPVPMPPSQMRISKHLRVRDWIFSAFLGPLQANIKVLRIGNVLMIGMPCDFSGEISVSEHLDEYAASNGLQLFITSFNGNYIGYITEDDYYFKSNHDEVRTMNWTGPYMGSYFSSYIKEIIEQAAADPALKNISGL